MSETYYLSYDPEELYKEMQMAYAAESGEILWPGDEKETLLRAAESIFIQALAGVDHALRMGTLRYAVGDYLDLIGENRGCIRNKSRKAIAEIEIQAEAGEERTIRAGSQLTADGDQIYTLRSDVVLTGQDQVVRTEIEAVNAGSVGNGLAKGTEMQLLTTRGGITRILCTASAQGGQEEETDDNYRDRIRTYGLTSTTTGPRERYEAEAKAVSSQIIDAKAVNLGPGKVGVAVLLGDTEIGSLLEEVEESLNDQTVRPLTDQVNVMLAEEKTYRLELKYQAQARDNIASSVAAAVKEYQAWQEEAIGRAFNPDRLMAMVYQAGAIRVSWGDGSHFDGQPGVSYREIGQTERCKGTITIGVMT